jgi:hypothetical protein
VLLSFVAGDGSAHVARWPFLRPGPALDRSLAGWIAEASKEEPGGPVKAIIAPSVAPFTLHLPLVLFFFLFFRVPDGSAKAQCYWCVHCRFR